MVVWYILAERPFNILICFQKLINEHAGLVEVGQGLQFMKVCALEMHLASLIPSKKLF